MAQERIAKSFFPEKAGFISREPELPLRLVPGMQGRSTTGRFTEKGSSRRTLALAAPLAFQVSFGFSRALDYLEKMRSSVTPEELDEQILQLLLHTASELKKTTPGGDQRYDTTPITRGDQKPSPRSWRRLRDLWEVTFDKREGRAIRYRLYNSTKFRPLLRWLEYGTRQREVGTAVSNIAPLKGKRRDVKGQFTAIVKRRLFIPEGAFPGSRHPAHWRSKGNGISYFIFKNVKRRGIKARGFFNRAARNFARAAENLKKRFDARMREAARS